MLDACCRGKERYLIHQTLLGLLTVGGTPEWVMILCLDGGMMRTGFMPNSQGPTPTFSLFIFLLLPHRRAGSFYSWLGGNGRLV